MSTEALYVCKHCGQSSDSAALTALPDDAPLQVVVARYREKVDWLAKLPAGTNVLIYNKGAPLDVRSMTHLNIEVRAVPNVGRESETYARYIIEHYAVLPPRILFTQADPFPHAPEFLRAVEELVLNVDMETAVRDRITPVTIQYMPDLPPSAITARRSNPLYRLETMSNYTLNSVYFHDRGTTGIMNGYLAANGLQVRRLTCTTVDYRILP
jgi:hypothetical protein